jgi:transcriptional/translational regulatory protein YebC/TACO1
MAGHSKWANIKHRKGRSGCGQARQGLHQATSVKSSTAARIGGPSDPADNPRLRAPVTPRPSPANMTRETSSTAPSPVAPVVATASKKLDDHRPTKATASAGSWPSLVECHDRQPQPYRQPKCAMPFQQAAAATWGPMAPSPTCSPRKRLLIFLPAGVERRQALMEAALEVRCADDVQTDEDGVTVEVYDHPERLRCRAGCAGSRRPQGPERSEVTMIAVDPVRNHRRWIRRKPPPSMMRLIDMLEDLDDVQNVYTNADFSADVMAALNK